METPVRPNTVRVSWRTSVADTIEPFEHADAMGAPHRHTRSGGFDMAEQLRAAETHALATITRLVIAADGDTLCRDVYLRRALELLAPIVSEASWAAALTGHEQLARLLSQAQAAVARRDWPQVREVGARATALQRSIAKRATTYGRGRCGLRQHPRL
jgi:hypothetical protein